MVEKIHLHSTCQDLVSRMSNLGMTIKTAGVAFFGAGVAHYLTSDISTFSMTQKRTYLFVLGLIGIMFNYLDASYLSRERSARYVDRKILENKWDLAYIDLNQILNNKIEYPSTRKINCMKSWAILPIIFMQIIVILTLALAKL